ncbi:MAG: DUF4357 domain-containing protein [Lachnospiraceae bacterium]|nr:DUF4357 domain-containing protein [Lachnospiraceae bacterium]
MKVHVILQPRNTDAYAEAVYDGKTITVLPGGRISADFAAHIQGGRKAKSFRNNPEFVDADRNIIKECVFTSPSTAAQFVTGRSTNGYDAWKVEAKKNLGKYLEEQGLRTK